jgi:outer membrane protein assembly factor BamB
MVDKKLRALDGKDGSRLWETDLEAPCALAPAVGDDNTIYTVTCRQKIHALDGSTGEKKWCTTVEGTASCPPVHGNDGSLIFILSRGTGAGIVVALNGATGEVLWQHEAGCTLNNAQPVVGPDNTVVFNSRYYLHALDGKSGAEKWKLPIGDAYGTKPVIDDKGIITIGLSSTSDTSKILAVDSTGTKKWEHDTGSRSILSPPVSSGEGTLLFGCDYGLACLRPPVSAGDIALAADREGENHGIETADDCVLIDGLRLPVMKSVPGAFRAPAIRGLS